MAVPVLVCMLVYQLHTFEWRVSRMHRNAGSCLYLWNKGTGGPLNPTVRNNNPLNPHNHRLSFSTRPFRSLHYQYSSHCVNL